MRQEIKSCEQIWSRNLTNTSRLISILWLTELREQILIASCCPKLVWQFNFGVFYTFETKKKPLPNGGFRSGQAEYAHPNANMVRALLPFSKEFTNFKQMLCHLIKIHKPVQFG